MLLFSVILSSKDTVDTLTEAFAWILDDSTASQHPETGKNYRSYAAEKTNKYGYDE